MHPIDAVFGVLVINVLGLPPMDDIVLPAALHSSIGSSPRGAHLGGAREQGSRSALACSAAQRVAVAHDQLAAGVLAAVGVSSVGAGPTLLPAPSHPARERSGT
jgi:hypothetical protein